MSDPIANMITKLKNAVAADKQTVSIPFSEMKWAISELLRKEGYVKSVTKKGKKVTKTIDIELINGEHPGIKNVERVSHYSRRMYTGVRSVFPVKQGQGTLVLSTPKGILTGSEARKAKVGGETLFKIW